MSEQFQFSYWNNVVLCHIHKCRRCSYRSDIKHILLLECPNLCSGLDCRLVTGIGFPDGPFSRSITYSIHVDSGTFVKVLDSTIELQPHRFPLWSSQLSATPSRLTTMLPSDLYLLPAVVKEASIALKGTWSHCKSMEALGLITCRTTVFSKTCKAPTI